MYSVCAPVAPPTLCGSPTVIWNIGFAASTTLTLGCTCLDGVSLIGGCTGGGTLGLEILSPFSSSTSSSPLKVRTEACDVDAGGLDVRIGICCSVGLSTNVSSDCVAATKLSPSGPRGPRESSTASNRVTCPPMRLGVRDALPANRPPVLDVF